MIHRGYYLLAAISILLVGVAVTGCRQATATPTTSPTGLPTEGAVVEVASKVRRELAVVWSGANGSDPISLPTLDDGEWHDLDAGGWVFTDDKGEGWVRISDCMLIYVFQHSRLVKAACPKSDYTGGNVTCSIEGTSVYNNSCGAQIITQTPSAELVLEGTWLSVTYLPTRQLTLVLVFEGQVKARPVQDVDNYVLGEAIDVAEGYFWFTTPGVTADPIAGLSAREPHPFDQLLPVVEELDLWHWIDRIKIRADADNIPYPAIPPFVFAPATETLITQLTTAPVPPTLTATPCWPPPNWMVYVVQANDTLYSLATKTGTSVDQVKHANCLVGDTVFIGQRLFLPFIPPTPTFTATPCGPSPNWVFYVVQAGDTLSSLARRTGTTTAQIRQANCMVSEYIYVGQRLYLPFLHVTPTFTLTPIPSLPDLVVTTFETTGPATINSEGRIEVPIRVVVADQGGAVANTFKISVEYTGQEGAVVVPFTVPGQEDSWYPYAEAPLSAGSEVSFVGKVSFNNVLQSQTVLLKAIADSCVGDELLSSYCRVEESDDGNNESSNMPVLLPTCVDFEDLPLDRTYKTGDTFVDSGVTITLRPFVEPKGTETYEGYALVGGYGNARGSGNEMGMSDVNADLNFGGRLAGLSLLFGEFGGNLNIEINGDLRNFDNFADIDGLTIGGVNISVVNGKGTGSLKVTGTINSFAIGGQELFIDDVCP